MVARSERLVVQVSPEIKAKLERLAEERFISVSALVSNILGKAVRMEELEVEYRKALLDRLGGADIIR